MDSQTPRVILERVDYGSTMRFSRLFGCFRTAISGSRLLPAWLLIVGLYIGGNVLDLIGGARVLPGEFDSYVSMGSDEFDAWRGATAAADPSPARAEVFSTAMVESLRTFDELVRAALSLRVGLDQFAAGSDPLDVSIMGALRRMLLVPAWLWHAHWFYLLVFLALFVTLWSLLGGALSRQTMVESSRYRLVPATEAVAFVYRRWFHYLAAPLLPLVLIIGLGLVLVVFGLLFRIALLNIAAGLVFPLAMVLGAIMALLLVGWVAGVHLIYPALSAEGTDFLEAFVRAFSYVVARPWRLLWYSFVALVYGAATYLFLALLAFLVVYLTQWAVGGGGGDVFEALLPPPRLGHVSDMAPVGDAGWTDKATGVLVRMWVMLFISLLGAYVITYYFSAYSVIYLLLRQSADGTDPAEMFEADGAGSSSPVSDKLEPDTATVAAAPGAGDETGDAEPGGEDAGGAGESDEPRRGAGDDEPA